MAGEKNCPGNSVTPCMQHKYRRQATDGGDGRSRAIDGAGSRPAPPQQSGRGLSSSGAEVGADDDGDGGDGDGVSAKPMVDSV